MTGRSGDPTPKGPGRVRPLNAALLSVSLIVGLVVGWSLRPIWESTDHVLPLISWRQPLVLIFMAALVGWTAWATHRTITVHKTPLPAHQGLNRLVLAKTSAVLGAFAAGGYAGHALSWLGIVPDLTGPRIVRPVVCALCAGLIVLAGILLERACRIPEDPEEPVEPTEPTAA